MRTSRMDMNTDKHAVIGGAAVAFLKAMFLQVNLPTYSFWDQITQFLSHTASAFYYGIVGGLAAAICKKMFDIYYPIANRKLKRAFVFIKRIFFCWRHNRKK